MTDTEHMRSFLAQQDHMQVSKFVLDCLDFPETLTLFLLLYAIRLDWLKHCNLIFCTLQRYIICILQVTHVSAHRSLHQVGTAM